ncbi:MAG: TrkA family potassium uptake protein [Clostridiales bacterium]|jgi:trk system potassium uptake protein TrkA|nr:TrkA family potassium uptake protein [Clostridiales bacterium]
MKSRIFIIGGFNKTKFLAHSLIKKGYSVTAINDDNDKCIALAEIDRLEVFHGDGSKPFVLEDAGIQGADMAIALSDKDADNLVICELSKKRFKVKRTVAMISDPKKIDFFYSMGIDSVVCSVTTIASYIEQQAFMDEITTLIPIGENNIKVSQVHILDGAPAVGKKLKDLNLPKEVIVGCVQRGDRSLIPRGDTRVLAGDVLVLISSDDHETVAVLELTGR